MNQMPSQPTFARRTYHSVRADARYEQLPMRAEHVAALYPAVDLERLVEGSWEPIAENAGRESWCRPRNGYFQVVVYSHQNPVSRQLLQMEPVNTQDDAEWSVWMLSDGSGYAVSSTFCVTAGPFGHQDEVNSWLDRHGLALLNSGHFVEGVAYFADLESGCFGDAIERLSWLEAVLQELERRYDEASIELWGQLRLRSDAAMISGGAECYAHGELVAPPSHTPGPVEPKQRIPQWHRPCEGHPDLGVADEKP